jgi:hypothetical protein
MPVDQEGPWSVNISRFRANLQNVGLVRLGDLAFRHAGFASHARIDRMLAAGWDRHNLVFVTRLLGIGGGLGAYLAGSQVAFLGGHGKLQKFGFPVVTAGRAVPFQQVPLRLHSR